jgi:hypothetical protein
MLHTTRRRLSAFALAGSLFLLSPAGLAMGDPPAAQPPCLQGTYIQLISNNGNWDEAAWSRQFKELRALQIENLIVQWTVYDDMAFYRSGRFHPTPMPPLETLLDLADSGGMRVMVGLSHDSAYWIKIRQADKRSYLIERLRKNITVAAELQPLVLKHKSFAGWYISEEIDDVHWNAQEARAALLNYLQQLSTYLHTATPAAAVGISGFGNKQTKPAELERFWTALLRQASAIDIVYFQDGIGVGKLTLDVLPQYYDAIRSAAEANNREFVPVIEAFRQISGEPISEGPFAAAPPDLQRLLRQLALAGQFSSRNVAFGVPEYLMTAAGPAASQAYAEYLRHMLPARSRGEMQSTTR